MAKQNKMNEDEYNDNINATEVKLENTGEIELPKMDLNKYIGKRVKIESVKTYQHPAYGYNVRVATEPIETIKNKDGKEILIRASDIFGLQKSEDGKIGWGKETKLGNFLKKMHTNHYNELMGKEVIITRKTNKNGQDFLSLMAP